MEDPNADSEDAETSSEDSWILLSNDEAIADLTSVEDNRNFTVNSLNEAVDGLTDLRIKNIHSDTESDGISIIGESDYSQISESDDDCNNNAIETQSESHEINEDSSIKADELLNEIHTEEQYENLIIVDTDKSANEYLVNEKNCLFNLKESIGSINVEKDLPNVMEAEQGVTIEKLSSKIISDRLTDETSSYICLNHLKQLVTWPSFLCTSIVIFAVIIFPYFSSKIDNANTLDQPDAKQFDEISLADKNIGVLDYLDLVHCMEIIREENDNPYFKRCMKRLLKHRKRFKNNDFTLQFISSSRVENKDSNVIEYIDKFLLKKKYKRMEEYNRYENGKYKKLSKKSPIPLNFILEDYDVSGEDIENYNEKNSFTNENQEKYIAELQNPHQGEDNDSKEKNFKTQFEREALDKSKDQLEELRKSLLRKEIFLKKWQDQLTKREIRLKDKVKKNYRDKKKHFGKFKKQKGELEKDVYENKNNRYTKQIHESILNDKQNKYDKQLKNPVECTDKKNIKGICKMKGIFHKKNQRNYKAKKEALPAFLRENIYNESAKKLNLTFNSKYLRVPTVAKKNRTNMVDENITVDGEWYINLLHGRHDIRKREERASWWFDRAEFRKNRRNKAFWYFQYMINRENLRYRQKKF
ncbi:hypothetical protein WA026_008796 [Henosepilachna vigintioctopunctata]|uniref:Uncharacterized protein n=1 Tax=Henosepilachna vigintioctopunctata TaxID=420089 RepID=A0AAW1VD55_9CUCU